MNKLNTALLFLLFNYSIVTATPNINARTAIVVDYHSGKVYMN